MPRVRPSQQIKRQFKAAGHHLKKETKFNADLKGIGRLAAQGSTEEVKNAKAQLKRLTAKVSGKQAQVAAKIDRLKKPGSKKADKLHVNEERLLSEERTLRKLDQALARQEKLHDQPEGYHQGMMERMERLDTPLTGDQLEFFEESAINALESPMLQLVRDNYGEAAARKLFLDSVDDHLQSQRGHLVGKIKRNAPLPLKEALQLIGRSAGESSPELASEMERALAALEPSPIKDELQEARLKVDIELLKSEISDLPDDLIDSIAGGLEFQGEPLPKDRRHELAAAIKAGVADPAYQTVIETLGEKAATQLFSKAFRAYLRDNKTDLATQIRANVPEGLDALYRLDREVKAARSEPEKHDSASLLELNDRLASALSNVRLRSIDSPAHQQLLEALEKTLESPPPDLDTLTRLAERREGYRFALSSKERLLFAKLFAQHGEKGLAQASRFYQRAQGTAELPANFVGTSFLKRVQSPSLRDGFNTSEACRLIGEHLEQLEVPNVSKEARQIVNDTGGRLQQAVWTTFMNNLEREGIAHQPVSAGDHAMQLVVQRQGETYRVLLFNTGLGLDNHPKIGERYQTYFGYDNVTKDQLQSLLPELAAVTVQWRESRGDSPDAIERVYDCIRSLNATPLPPIADPLMGMREQLRGTCSVSVLIAVMRYLVMNQPGKSAAECHREWKLVKAALDQRIWVNAKENPLPDPTLMLLARSRAEKVAGDIQLAQIAGRDDEDAFVHYSGLEADWSSMDSSERFNQLRQANHALVGEWLKDYPKKAELDDLPEAQQPAKAAYDYHYQQLSKLEGDVSATDDEDWLRGAEARLGHTSFPDAYRAAFDAGMSKRGT